MGLRIANPVPPKICATQHEYSKGFTIYDSESYAAAVNRHPSFWQTRDGVNFMPTQNWTHCRKVQQRAASNPNRYSLPLRLGSKLAAEGSETYAIRDG